ncbi:flavin monoamine oxidase family protein [Saccharomonospora piscinae]|uniref:flavin monoamine oxidase family protein n=1 Tax=Saccharomonospora piscinae TaxID=687388 RepID=UPI000466D398|nr:FAD-dependent oxidoreductase [Saccharomonospora piscinae]
MSEIRRCDVVVIGAGLAGLTAAWRLHRAGVDVQVLEAASTAGGRVHGEPTSTGRVLDTGAEFVGPGHHGLLGLLGEFGLRTVPAGLDTSPIRWRLPDLTRTSRLPPIPRADLWRLARGLWLFRRHALELDPGEPWRTPAGSRLDMVSLADWLHFHGVTPRGLQVTEALVGGFATTHTRTLSAAHAARWIAVAGGLVPALRSGHANVVVGGAYQIAERLAERLGAAIRVDTQATAVAEHTRGVEVTTRSGARWQAAAAVVAVPLPALRKLTLEPVPPLSWRTAVDALGYGQATKIAAVTRTAPTVVHRVVLGGRTLAVAWRQGQQVAGLATGAGPHPTTDLTEDLAAAFGLIPGDFSDTVVTNWTTRPHLGGSYLTYRPGQLALHGPALRAVGTRRVRYAGADHSRWPNSMEGAVHTGHVAADALLADSSL